MFCYGVATISRLLKIIGLFRKRALSKRLYSAKETSNSKEPTNRSQRILLALSNIKIDVHVNIQGRRIPTYIL